LESSSFGRDPTDWSASNHSRAFQASATLWSAAAWRRFVIELACSRDGKLFMKFTFGAQNENEVVFVRGESEKIEFLFTELCGAKKIK
jgi:hypothetical protein